MTYLLIKMIHILSGAVLFGTGAGIAFFMLRAHATRDARTVADVLRERAPSLDLKVEGRGEAEPVAPNSTDAGKKKNRRVTVTYEVSK